MYKRMIEDMDINCGEIVDGTATLDEMGQKIFQLFLDTASGKATCSEALNLGRHEFVPWQIGVVG
jgi:altronate hydrolase